MSHQKFKKLCSRFITAGDTHDRCIVCLGLHHAHASWLAAGPDMYPVGRNPAANTLQDPIQQNTASLTHALPVLTDAASFSVLGNSNACGCITATDGSLEATKEFPSCLGALARHFAMGVMNNSLWIYHSVSKRPASFLQDSPNDREFKRNRSAATRDVISTEERGYRGSTPLSDGVRFLQPIFCCAQERWRITTNIGLTPFESCTQNEQIQDVDSKIYSVSDSTKRLVCHDQPEDAYFHIQIIKRHRKFLRFALEGRAYQYRVLPFRLALVPQTFTKCMDAVLALFGETEEYSNVKGLDVVQISQERSSAGGLFSPRDCHDGRIIDILGAVCQGCPAHGT